jgi:DNA-binding transcriptional regulator PaaX
METRPVATNWLLLVYRIPRKPTAGRVYVWRKLKQLGAIALQDAVWVLPKTPRTQEQFQWLSAEISELQGEAILWEAAQLYATDANALLRQFIEPVDAEYREILAALKKKDRDLSALSKRFQEAQTRDYFGSPVGLKTREKLLAAGGG